MTCGHEWVSGVEPGTPLDEVPTPSLLLAVPTLEENIRRMTELCRTHGKQWRPHIKGHRCAEIIERLCRAGWSGLTCATLREAEFAASLGVRDLLIANQVAVDKMDRAARLARICDLILTFDDKAQVEAAAAAASETGVTIRGIVEVDVGMNRAGLQRVDDVIGLAEHIDRSSGLRLAGIMGYEGHLLAVPDVQEKADRIRKALDFLQEVRDRLWAKGLNCDIVSAGGTGSCEWTVKHPAVTELQAGGLVMMDAYYRNECNIKRFDYALTVTSTIVSRPSSDRAIIDAGRKTHDVSLRPPEFLGAPPSITVLALNAEHGILRVQGEAARLPVGTRLELVPGYSDFTTMLHRCFVAHDGETVLGLWEIGPR